MDLQKFDELSDSTVKLRNLLAQDMTEWRFYLEIVSAYFKAREITRPLVVEIGLMHNAQRVFYGELLGAEHIGIDINENSKPDILGDSHSEGIRDIFTGKFPGRIIDLLFIDGNHSYESVRRDFELYAQFTKHIIAIHDIRARVNSEVYKFWEEIQQDPKYLAITLNRFNKKPDIVKGEFTDMGIGLLIRI